MPSWLVDALNYADRISPRVERGCQACKRQKLYRSVQQPCQRHHWQWCVETRNGRFRLGQRIAKKVVWLQLTRASFRPPREPIWLNNPPHEFGQIPQCMKQRGPTKRPAMITRHGGDFDQGSSAIPTTGSPPPTVPRDLATPVFRSMVTQRLAAPPSLFKAAKATSLKT